MGLADLLDAIGETLTLLPAKSGKYSSGKKIALGLVVFVVLLLIVAFSIDAMNQ